MNVYSCYIRKTSFQRYQGVGFKAYFEVQIKSLKSLCKVDNLFKIREK